MYLNFEKSRLSDVGGPVAEQTLARVEKIKLRLILARNWQSKGCNKLKILK